MCFKFLAVRTLLSSLQHIQACLRDHNVTMNTVVPSIRLHNIDRKVSLISDPDQKEPQANSSAGQPGANLKMFSTRQTGVGRWPDWV